MSPSGVEIDENLFIFFCNFSDSRVETRVASSDERRAPSNNIISQITGEQQREHVNSR